MTTPDPLTESELAEVAVALDMWGHTFMSARETRWKKSRALYAKIAALNEGADK